MQSAESIREANFEATIFHLEQKLDSIIKLLASLCEHLEKTSQLEILATIEDGKLARWWGKHKKDKADLIAREKAIEARGIAHKREEQERKDARDKILKKLSPEDKKILGIS